MERGCQHFLKTMAELSPPASKHGTEIFLSSSAGSAPVSAYMALLVCISIAGALCGLGAALVPV